GTSISTRAPASSRLISAGFEPRWTGRSKWRSSRPSGVSATRLMRPNPLFRTALFRLSLLHVAVFLSSALVLAIGGSFLLKLILEREFRDEVVGEIDSLAALTPRERIADEIRKRQTDGEHHKFHYLLQSAEGQVVVGNLPAMTPVEGWTKVVTAQDDAD